MNTNASATETQFDVMRSQISDSFEKVQEQKNILKRKSDRYMTANITLAALSTLLAGMAGTIGSAQNWKPVCLFAAVCSAGVTVTSKLQTAERLTATSECMGQLRFFRSTQRLMFNCYCHYKCSRSFSRSTLRIG
jgi:hypothetical protein